MEGLSESLHYELAPLGIRVKVIEPGGIKTDFGGRSFDFNNDESLSQYQQIVGAFFTAQAQLGTAGDDPVVVAETIYQAATDATDQLRYTAGPYATELIAARSSADDSTFIAGIKNQFGI